MQVLRESDANEMVACFLGGELTSERFGPAIRHELIDHALSDELLTAPDLSDDSANLARRSLLAAARGYGQDRELFRHFPIDVPWVWARMPPDELAAVRYIEYSYWNELTGGSRLAVEAARRIRSGITVFGVSNERFLRAADAVERGVVFPPLILAGPAPHRLVCLEGNLRLTAYALRGFPTDLDCLVAVDARLARWAA